MGSPTTRSDDRPGTVLVTGGAGYIGSHAAKALAAAGRPVVIYDNLSQGHREAALGADLVVGDTRDVSLLRSVIASRGVTAVMHFAAWAAVGDSVRDPAGYYGNNVEGTLSVLRAMAEERVPVVHLLVDLRRVRRAGGGAARRDASDAARSTPTARRSWPSSARCRTSSAPTACARSASATSTRRVRTRTAQLGEDHRPGAAPDPAGARRGEGRSAPAGVRGRLPDAGRDVPERLHPRDRPGAGAPAGARGARAGRERRACSTSATGGRSRCATCCSRWSA